MAEEVINYGGSGEMPWWARKRKGLTNRYHKYKRHLLWALHVRTTRIELDYGKLPAGVTPVIINNFNRLALVREQVDWLLGLREPVAVVIVDNDSTYPPLLDYYDQLDHPLVQVVRLGFNSWRKGAAYVAREKLRAFDRYVITDSDLLPYPETPPDLIAHLSALLDRYPEYNHVGTSLRITDLPDHYPLKETVIGYESRFWPPAARERGGDGYEALIDTTFAMYRRGSSVLATGPALRTKHPYTLRHVDWYTDPAAISPEFEYYLKSCKSFATWAFEAKRQAASSE